MLTATLLLLGVVLVAMSLAERHVTRLPLSPATVYLAVGAAAGALAPPLSVDDALRHAPALVVVTEFAVLISLFTVGLRLRVPPTWKAWRVAVLLASVGMLATIVFAAAAAAWLLGLGLAAALLLATILAPTDPVLASEVQIRSEGDRDCGAPGAHRRGRLERWHRVADHDVCARPARPARAGSLRRAMVAARSAVADRRRPGDRRALRPRARPRGAGAVAARP